MKYQNITDQQLIVIGFGVIQPGGIVEDDRVIENPSLRFIDTTPDPVQTDPVRPPDELVPSQPI